MAKRKNIVKKNPAKKRGGLSLKERNALEADILKYAPKNVRTEIEEENLFKEFNKAFEAEYTKELLTPTAKHLKASPIQYDKAGMAKLRKMVRKSDGTFFSKRYYDNLLKKVSGKSKDDFDDALIALRNKNPKMRYFIESKTFINYFQVGNFVDRLAGRKQTVSLGKGKFKRKGKAVFTGEMKKGTSMSVTTFLGDENEFKSVIKANDAIRTETSYIDKVLAILSPPEKTKNKKQKGLTQKPRRKGTGIYILIEELVTSNSEKEVVKISYNYEKYEVQGIEKQIFAEILDEVIHA